MRRPGLNGPALRLEGKYTRIAYNYPKERSSLEVMRNYQAALDKAGLKVLFSCAKKTCGADFGQFFLDKRVGDNFIKGPEASWSPFNYGRNDNRYVLAKGTRPDGSLVHVGVYVVAPVQDQIGGVHVEIVEAKAMEGGKVSASLNAADMAEMAKLLQQDPKLKVYVVGHTDNQGVLAHNVELSQKRADAVVKALAVDDKIDARRLSAKGVASYSPVASNGADAGREKNRRVELVKQ